MKNKPISVRDINNHKACSVIKSDSKVVIEIKRKDAITQVVIGPNLDTIYYSYPTHF